MFSPQAPKWRASVSALAFLSMIASAAEHQAVPPVEQLVSKMAEADGRRNLALLSYSAVRQYTLVNERFNKRAQIIVQVQYRRPGRKSFQMVSHEGSTFLIERVLKRLVKAEEDGSQSDNRQLSRIDSSNYRLRVIGTETLREHNCYVLELAPLSKSPYLVRGHAWIDSTDYAVVRVQGLLAKKPSIWVGTPRITQDYVKQGEFWLPAASISTTDAPIFGRTDLKIEYTEYQLHSQSPPIQWSERTIGGSN